MCTQPCCGCQLVGVCVCCHSPASTCEAPTVCQALCLPRTQAPVCTNPRHGHRSSAQQTTHRSPLSGAFLLHGLQAGPPSCRPVLLALLGAGTRAWVGVRGGGLLGKAAPPPPLLPAAIPPSGTPVANLAPGKEPLAELGTGFHPVLCVPGRFNSLPLSGPQLPLLPNRQGYGGEPQGCRPAVCGVVMTCRPPWCRGEWPPGWRLSHGKEWEECFACCVLPAQ